MELDKLADNFRRKDGMNIMRNLNMIDMSIDYTMIHSTGAAPGGAQWFASGKRPYKIKRW